jgi:hypothetical protein
VWFWSDCMIPRPRSIQVWSSSQSSEIQVVIAADHFNRGTMSMWGSLICERSYIKMAMLPCVKHQCSQQIHNNLKSPRAYGFRYQME